MTINKKLIKWFNKEEKDGDKIIFQRMKDTYYTRIIKSEKYTYFANENKTLK